MIDAMFVFLRELRYFRTDQFLTALLGILALIFFLGYSRIVASKRGKSLFRIGIASCVIAAGLTIGLYLWRPPHGLSGSYYANSGWSDTPYVELERYFETNGRRVDRFIDFNPNDFNDRYPFSGRPFSVKWQGWMYVPDNGYQFGVTSNFGTWLYVDDELIEGHHKIDFGTPAARAYLREGWSVDERWGEDPDLTFVWSSGERSEFYLGVDELADYQLLFRCMPFSYQGNPNRELVIYINGIALESPVVLQDGWNMYSVPVPRSVIQDKVPGFFRVKFAYSHVVRPADVMEQSKDERELGAAFDFALLRKSSDQTVVTSVAQQSRVLSQGLHRVTLKASQNEKDVDSFIQFIWKRAESGRTEIISEDYLFPETFLPELIRQVLLREHILLGALTTYKLCLITLLGGVIIIYIVPCYLRKLRTRDVLFILGIGLFAFGIRILFLLEMKKIDPDFYILPLGTDQLNYVFFARGFFRGYWPGLSHETFFQSPFISFYFILCSVLFGESLTAIRIMTVLMSVGSIFFTYLIAERTFNKPVAYITALLCAGNGILIFYSTSLLIAPVVIFLNLAALWLVYKLKERLSWQTTFALGIILGMSVLARANIFLLMPFLLFWMLFYFTDTFRRKILHYAGLCLVIIMTIMPVTLWNYFLSDGQRLVLTNSNGGITFWIGNNASSDGRFSYSRALHKETKKRMKATGSSYAREVARYIKDHPLEYLKLEYKKLKMFWRGYENGNLIPYYFFREHYSNLLKFPWLNFVVIGPLGIVGMFLAIKHWRKLFLLYGFVCVQILTTLLFFALARYRLPVVPVLSMFATYAAWYSVQQFQQKKWCPLGITIGLFLVFYFLCNVPYAMYLYQFHHGEPMPLIKIFRYWDLFHTQQ